MCVPNLLNSFDFRIQVWNILLKLFNMQDTNEDTEWNDVLRAKGIIPDKPKEAEINEDDVLMVNEVQAKKEKVSMYRFFQDMKVVGETEIKE